VGIKPCQLIINNKIRIPIYVLTVAPCANGGGVVTLVIFFEKPSFSLLGFSLKVI